ncbi:hypothetical protein GGS26DRAFT_554336 [Hypomontagnella submonticulosa]|nr:hypothetical protein GGS26DRAFT_554336 [Hypomontagnella submonticulosa]
MPRRRNDRSPTEADSGSDVGVNLALPDEPKKSIPEAIQSIDKWKSKRSEVQKSIDKDFTDRLRAIKTKIQAYYEDETQKLADRDQQQLERLVAALGKRLDCEEKIDKRIDSLRDDCAHMAMLMDAVYTGRKEAATQSARASSSKIPQG